MVNNLKKLPEGARTVIANSPALLDFMVAAYDQKREDLVNEVRSAKSVDQAQEIAKAANAVSELDAVPGKTIYDLYAATGESPTDGGCYAPHRWDPITQTCVLA